MELVLNLVWAALAFSLVGLWLRFAPPAGPERRRQFAAIALLILILFPVISVTDDLQVAQNPAEADSCLRRDHDVFNPHSILPAIADLPRMPIGELFQASTRFLAFSNPPRLLLISPDLPAVQKRPPPAA